MLRNNLLLAGPGFVILTNIILKYNQKQVLRGRLHKLNNCNRKETYTYLNQGQQQWYTTELKSVRATNMSF